jgi:hypothetical protein
MNDDFRVHFTLPNHANPKDLQKSFQDTGLTHLLGEQLQHIAVSIDGNEVFLYAGSDQDAEQVASAVTAFGKESGWTITPEIRRWHPAAEEWEDPSAPLPVASDAVAAEHAEVIAAERAETAKYGLTEWEVRVQCDSHADCVSLAATLRSEGIPNVRRSRYLLIGVTDEDTGAQILERVKGMAGVTGASFESTLRGVEMAAAEEKGRANPFRLFTGPVFFA